MHILNLLIIYRLVFLLFQQMKNYAITGKDLIVYLPKKISAILLVQLMPLFICNSNNYMDQYEGIDKQIKLSIIELLISMDIPLDVILFCLGTIIQNKIVINKEIYIKNQKEKCYETPIKQSIYEAKIFHFIYSYILLNPNKYTKENNENDIIEIWKEIITILNIRRF